MKDTPTTIDDLNDFLSFAKGGKHVFKFSNNCVIYTRVSTKEQADNNMSLATQLKSCELYAHKHGYHISGFYGGTYESAKTDERKEFNRMLSFVRKSRERISYIIVYSVDRFSRSGANAIYITDELKKQGILVIFVTQPTDASTSSGSLQQNIQYIFSAYDNQQRREKCMAGTKEALLRGEWCTVPPTGYDIIRKEGRKMIVVNEKGKLLRKAFLWKAHDNLSMEEIRIRLKDLCLSIPHQRLSVIFRNPFYCGLITHNALDGQIVEGKHEAMVSKEIFLKVNDILSARVQGFKVIRDNEHVPLKNFIKCGHCGDSMPGYLVRKKGLWYYKCRKKGCCNNKSAKVLHQQFLSLLEPYTLRLSAQARNFFKRRLHGVLSSEIETKREEEILIKKQMLEVNSKIDRLEEKFILDVITKEQYVKFSDKFKKEREEMNARLENC